MQNYSHLLTVYILYDAVMMIAVRKFIILQKYRSLEIKLFYFYHYGVRILLSSYMIV